MHSRVACSRQCGMAGCIQLDRCCPNNQSGDIMCDSAWPPPAPRVPQATGPRLGTFLKACCRCAAAGALVAATGLFVAAVKLVRLKLLLKQLRMRCCHLLVLSPHGVAGR